VIVKDKAAAFREFYRVLKPGGWYRCGNRQRQRDVQRRVLVGLEAAAPCATLRTLRDYFHPGPTVIRARLCRVDLLRACETPVSTAFHARRRRTFARRYR
jgi:ubiquinone/menaquinone biosynthesis C-methylase UbiE